MPTEQIRLLFSRSAHPRHRRVRFLRGTEPEPYRTEEAAIDELLKGIALRMPEIFRGPAFVASFSEDFPRDEQDLAEIMLLAMDVCLEKEGADVGSAA